MTPTTRRKATRSDVELGKRIRRIREEAGYSQEQIGIKMGKTGSAVAHWESGYSRISAVELAHLAAALACPVSEFYGEGRRAPFGEDAVLNEAYNKISPTVRQAIRLILLGEKNAVVAEMPESVTNR